MRSLGLRVPPAFVVTTEACAAYFARAGLPGRAGRRAGGRASGCSSGELGRRFGGAERPLLVSVRSGAAHSMPGMMDTILNLGMHRRGRGGAGRGERGPRVRRRDPPALQRVLRTPRAGLHRGARGPAGHRGGSGRHPRRRRGHRARPTRRSSCAPRSPRCSRRGARRRAMAYRKHHGIPDDRGTAVTVQAMVFGNLDDESGTGVLFTRNPLERRRASRTASTCRAARARTSSPARSPRWPLAAPRRARPDGARRAARPRRNALDARAATRRTSSSRSSAAGCSCCSPGPPSAPPAPPCGSRSSSSTRA